jgi:hypothetical protein
MTRKAVDDNRLKFLQALVDLLTTDGQMSARQAADRLQINRTTARYNLKLLVTEKRIQEVGAGIYAVPQRVESSPTTDMLAAASGSGTLPKSKGLVPEVLPSLERIAGLQARLKRDINRLGITGPVTGTVTRSRMHDAAGNQIHPNLAGIGKRSTQPEVTWRTVTGRDEKRKNDKLSTSTIPASFKTKLDNETDILNSYWGWVGILEPEYDLLEGYTLIDVDSYYRQSISRKLALAFRNGVETVGDNQEFVKYITRRAGQVGYMTGTTFKGLLKEVLFNLYVCSNCILLKIRDKDASGGYANEKNNDRVPVAGYKICPPQTIFPFMDGKGRIDRWRRFFGTGRPYKDYAVEDIIHFKWDVKPGHLFGTPRTVCVRDDVFALRRLEENIELLLVNHLFPLFHVQVGTEEAPAQMTADGISEIDVIKNLIQNCPKEGVLVTDERVKVEVHGASKEGVDPQPMLAHYKSRIFTGLGVSGLDLGEMDTGNRATAENVSQNLKDNIKADLDTFSDMATMQFFREWFQESNTQLSVQNAVADVRLEFHEIDVDTQIKKETHAANMFNNHGIDQTEYRKRMKMKPVENGQRKEMHFERHVLGLEDAKTKNQIKVVDVQHEHAMEQQESAQTAQHATAVHTAASTKSVKVTHKRVNGSSKTVHTTEPTKTAAKAVSNLMQPTNQHGKNLDPHKARSSQDPELLVQIHDAFAQLEEELRTAECMTVDQWNRGAWLLIQDMLPGDELHDARAWMLPFVVRNEDTLDTADLLYSSLRAWAADPIPGESEDVSDEKEVAAA